LGKSFEAWKKLPTLLINLEEAYEFLDPKIHKIIFQRLPSHTENIELD
jgi:hypothetical protein